jgi:hypothetical protein
MQFCLVFVQARFFFYFRFFVVDILQLKHQCKGYGSAETFLPCLNLMAFKQTVELELVLTTLTKKIYSDAFCGNF